MYKILIEASGQEILVEKWFAGNNLIVIRPAEAQKDDSEIVLTRDEMELLIEKMREMMDYKNES